MRNIKRFAVLSMAAAMTLGTLAITACDNSFTPLGNIPQGEVSSNGGFIVEKGDYLYFINGVETYTSDNTYGNVVKGALMRAKKSDLAAGNGAGETVVPSLMVASDYTAGIFVYGERVYYATPNNVKNTQGVIESEYLAFKSAKLDGSDVQSYFTLADNATVYRFVEKNGTVYMLYKEGNNLRSYNTVSKVDTLLAQDTTAILFDGSDKTNPTVYYSMPVTEDIDKGSEVATALDYNQIYKVDADATTAPYTYTFDEEYVKQYKEDNDGKELYVNLGTIVLDGVGSIYEGYYTQFTHDVTDTVTPATPGGYTYTLQSYQNGGLYFTRKEITTGGTNQSEWLYYLGSDELTSTWNSVEGNGAAYLDVVAKSTELASSTALFYKEADGSHHYIYTSGTEIHRVDVKVDGTGEVETDARIAVEVSSPTLSFVDTADATYKYVYYTQTNGSGVSINRVPFNQEYDNLNDDKNLKPVKVLNVEAVSDWYKFEIIDNVLYYADAQAFDSTSYSYISAVDLSEGNALMTNEQLAAFNEKYEEVVDYIDEIATEQDNAALSNAIKSYFYTGTDKYFTQNIQTAKDEGKSDTFLYTEEEKAAFNAYVAGKEGENDLPFDKENRTLSAFITRMGKMNEDDVKSLDDYWTTTLEHVEIAEEESEGLPVWAWILIGVAIALVVAAAIIVPILVVRKRKHTAEAEKEKKPLLAVDTTDDVEVDVYHMDEPTEGAEEPVEEAAPVEEQAVEDEAPEAVEEAVEEAENEEAPTEE